MAWGLVWSRQNGDSMAIVAGMAADADRELAARIDHRIVA